MRTHTSSPWIGTLLLALIAQPSTGQSALRTFQAGAGEQEFGFSCCGIGDVTGDGLADVAVGDPLWTPGQGFWGQVRVFNGNTGSLLYVLSGPQIACQFGYSIAGVGDLDHDARGDFIVGISAMDLQATNSGAAVVVSGVDGSTMFTVSGAVAGASLGTSVSGVGDVDGDQVPDFAAGAPGSRSARVYSGANASVLHTFFGTAPNDSFGHSISGAGDVDHDGHADIWVGANSPNPGGIGYIRLFSGADGHVIRTISSTITNDRFGSCVAGGSDIDGDGVPDVLAGSTHAQFPTSVGVLRVFSGATAGVLGEYFGQYFAEFPTKAAFVGDINNDGIADFIVGERSTNSKQQTRAQVVSGATRHVLFTLDSTPAEPGLGFAVTGIGDSSGDGIPDFLASSTQGAGYARSFSGLDHAPATYCQAKLNSLGCLPSIRCMGVPALGGDDNFRLVASDTLNQRAGLLIWGLQAATIPFAGGVLCLSPQTPIFRGMVHLSGGTPLPTQDCSGSYDAWLSHDLLLAKGLMPGATAYAQFISRDPGYAAPDNVGLSNALSFVIAP